MKGMKGLRNYGLLWDFCKKVVTFQRGRSVKPQTLVICLNRSGTAYADMERSTQHQFKKRKAVHYRQPFLSKFLSGGGGET